ncbi:hypothetical protein ACQY0O_002073 [Thecaphora frezii]
MPPTQRQARTLARRCLLLHAPPPPSPPTRGLATHGPISFEHLWLFHLPLLSPFSARPLSSKRAIPSCMRIRFGLLHRFASLRIGPVVPSAPSAPFSFPQPLLARSVMSNHAANQPNRGGASRGNVHRRGRGGNRAQRAPSAQQQQLHSAVSTTANTPIPSGTATPVAMDALDSSSDGTHLTPTLFSSLRGQIDQRLLDAIPFSHMSQVQAATLPTALSGRDVLAQAKTGTGKTMAFLIPSIQRLCALPTPPPASSISVLVLSPTRELALQIEKEASTLLANLGGQIEVQHVVGGTNIQSERARLRTKRKDLLIATPGRLLDHLENATPDLNLRDALGDLRVLVLDEADRMLDMGFRNEIEKIIRAIPAPRPELQRQSLFFSATIPSFVHEVAQLRPDHAFISTLKEEEVNVHLHVPQEFAVLPVHQLLPHLVLTLMAEAQRYPESHKVLVFLPTARSTSLHASIVGALARLPAFAALGAIFEIHSRKSQAARTRTMADFRAAKSGFLFSSDVTARGVDFPGISLVVQCGLPSSVEQYIHRLGRTARAGKDGRGVLLLAEFEQWFLRSAGVDKLPLREMDVEAVKREAGVAPDVCGGEVDRAMMQMDETVRSQAYQAHMGYYKTFLRATGWNAQDLIQHTNAYAYGTLLWKQAAVPADEARRTVPPPAWFVAPPLLAKTVGMMGLKGQKGLNIVKELPHRAGDGGGRGGQLPQQQAKQPRQQQGGNGGSNGSNKRARNPQSSGEGASRGNARRGRNNGRGGAAAAAGGGGGAVA